MKFNCTILKCLFFATICTYIQTAGADVVHIKGGSKYSGKILEQTEQSVRIQLDNGSDSTMTLPKSIIESIEIIEQKSVESQVTRTPVPLILVRPTDTPTLVPTQVTTTEAVGETDSATGLKKREKASSLTPTEIAQLGGDRKLFGKTKDTVGVVEIKRPGKDWEEKSTETYLFEGDLIRTRLGRTKIMTEGTAHQTELRLKEGSEAEVEKESTIPTINLIRGKIWSKVKSLSDNNEVKFRVRTPNAVAGIRGTLLSVEAGKESRVAVFEGMVEVTGRTAAARKETITQNKALRISQSDVFSQLENVDPEEIKEWDFWDEWAKQTKAELGVYYNHIPGVAPVIDGMIDSIAAENKLYEELVDLEGRRREKARDQQRALLNEVKESIIRYTIDVGHFPPEDRGLTYLQNNLTSSQRWRGPYLDSKFRLPLKDMWGAEIKLVYANSKADDRLYMKLISEGPNLRAEDGKGDDLLVLIDPAQFLGRQ